MLDYKAVKLELTAVVAKQQNADASLECILDSDIAGIDCSTLWCLDQRKSGHAAADLILRDYNRKMGTAPSIENASTVRNSFSFEYYR